MLMPRLIVLCISAATVCGPANSWAQTASDLFDGNILHEVGLEIHPDDWQKLRDNFMLNTYYPCNFSWNGLVVENVGIRSRGQGSRSGLKPGLRVDFDRYEESRKFLGLKSVVLRNNTQDASMLRERLSMLLFQRMGLPAPRETHARLYVNKEYIGLYTIVESVDKSFLHRNFGENDGYLYDYDYDAEDQPYYFEYRGTDPGLYSPKPFKPATHEKDPDARPIEAFIRTVNQVPDADFLQAVSEYIDLKLFITYVAVENFIAELDGFVGDYAMNNFYLYRFEGRNLSQLIPWDKSVAFSDLPSHSIWHNQDNAPPERQNVLMRRAISFPELRQAYEDSLMRCAALAGGEGGWLARELEREYSQIRTAALEDGNKLCLDGNGKLVPRPNDLFEASVDFLRDYIRNRSRYVLDAVLAERTLESVREFSLKQRSGISLETPDHSAPTVVGYAQYDTASGLGNPAGLAVFGYRQNNVLVSEAGIPAVTPIRKGRFYAETGDRIRTGLAIANPNGTDVLLSHYFTDMQGQKFGAGSLKVPAGGQIATFLDGPLIHSGMSIRGTFTFESPLPVAAVALRGYINERSEFLITTLSVTELVQNADVSVLLPHLADGGGWVTQIVLVNPTDATQGGTVSFFDQGNGGVTAAPLDVTIDGHTAASFEYSIPPGSARILRTSGFPKDVRTGSVRVSADPGQTVPSASSIFSFKSNGITVSEAGIAAGPRGTAFRMYVESLGDPAQNEVASIQTGIAIANQGELAVTVKLELVDLAGRPLGPGGSLTTPGNGQSSVLLRQIPGFESLPSPTQGVLRITTASPSGIAVTGLRGRMNERGEFLITTTPAVPEDAAPSGPLFFPHLAGGGGYTTQFVLFNRTAGEGCSGALKFYNQAGLSLKLPIF